MSRTVEGDSLGRDAIFGPDYPPLSPRPSFQLKATPRSPEIGMSSRCGSLGFRSTSDQALAVAGSLLQVALLLPQGAAGQVVIDLGGLCSECSISRTLRAKIGDSSEPDGLLYGTPIHLLELEDGSFILLTNDGGPPAVYDESGSFLRRIGGRGQGPLEFLLPSLALEAPGDSLLILDAGQNRALVVGPDGEARTISAMPPIRQIDILEWPEVITVGDAPSPEGVAQPFHLLDLSGLTADLTASLGPDESEERAGNPPEAWSVDSSTDSLFWAVGGADYVLELWNADGGRELRLQRPLAEYDSNNRYGIGSPTRPPPTKVVCSTQDSAGLIWVFLHVPRFDWQTAWKGLVPDARGEIVVSRASPMALDLYQTRVDVIDPQRRVLVYTTLIPTWSVPITGGHDPRLAGYSLDDVGNPAVEVWSLELTRPGGR